MMKDIPGNLIYHYNSGHFCIQRRQPGYSDVRIVDKHVGTSGELCNIPGREQQTLETARKVSICYAINVSSRLASGPTFGEDSDRVSSRQAAKYFVNVSARSPR